MRQARYLIATTKAPICKNSRGIIPKYETNINMKPLYHTPSAGQSSRRPLAIIRDTREQLPFLFYGYNADVRIGTLQSGDYSIACYENRVAVERKSLADLFHSLTNERERFEREIERLECYEFSAVVIEANWSVISDPVRFDPCWRSRANPKAVEATILSWSVKHRTRWFPCENRQHAERVTFDLLRFFERQSTKEVEA
ncbi:MAG: ERCC4 domain-containing protein [Thermoguttaceae bacterium]